MSRHIAAVLVGVAGIALTGSALAGPRIAAADEAKAPAVCGPPEVTGSLRTTSTRLRPELIVRGEEPACRVRNHLREYQLVVYPKARRAQDVTRPRLVEYVFGNSSTPMSFEFAKQMDLQRYSTVPVCLTQRHLIKRATPFGLPKANPGPPKGDDPTQELVALSCVVLRAENLAAPATWTVESLPVSDPLVDRVKFEETPMGPDPECPTCW